LVLRTVAFPKVPATLLSTMPENDSAPQQWIPLKPAVSAKDAW
jgi:hypothetical protein